MATKRLLLDQFLEAHARPPQQIIPDLDTTDDPVHGEQESLFFHDYYNYYCYLTHYVFCGRHLLVTKLRSASTDAAAGSMEEVARIVRHVRSRWPHVRILVCTDSGFARDNPMARCEVNGVDYVFGVPRNLRLSAEIKEELAQAEMKSRRARKPTRHFKELEWRTRSRWSCERRVIGKAEFTNGEANPRFVVTSLTRARCEPK